MVMLAVVIKILSQKKWYAKAQGGFLSFTSNYENVSSFQFELMFARDQVNLVAEHQRL
jgi:hypothetical protein